MTQTFQLVRPPRTDDELYHLIQILWGVTIPRTRVCPEHSTPFAALSEAFFGRAPVSVWVGSRGLGGKSRTLAYLSLTEAVLLGAEISLLGGSLEQSQNIHNAMRDGWDHPLAPRHMKVDDTVTRLKLDNGSLVRPLTASEKTVRGPHPQRLRLDEIDVMDISILDSAMGQPMPKNGIDTQTVMSSTHQNPAGTMTEILTRAAESDWPVHRWCYKETSNPVDGWLSPDFIDRKRSETTAQMFAIEYDLQEPSVGNRAFDTSSVERMFVDAPDPFAPTIESPLIRQNGRVEKYVLVEPVREGDYVIAADWAKEQDYTVISVWRYDTDEMILVAYYRAQRLPWPVMVGQYNEWLSYYGCNKAIHDGTGVGNVVNDYIDRRSRPFLMTGRQRNEMLTEYIAAVERDLVRSARITSAYTAHKYASYEQIYNIGQDSHLPDEICSFALAWKATGRKIPFAAPIEIPRLVEGMTEEHLTDAYQPSSPWRDIGGKPRQYDFDVTHMDVDALDAAYGGYALGL